MENIDKDREDLPPELKQFLAEKRQVEQRKKIEEIEKVLHDPETGLIVRVKAAENEISRWVGRENWWKNLLNHVIKAVVVAAALAAMARIGTLFF